MDPLKIMIIRHAEKPGDREGRAPPFGVDEEGRADPRSLTPLGWQRAGALAAWFGGALGRPAGIETPRALFAPNDRGTSHRSRQTLVPLGRLLRLPIHADCPVGVEEQLAPVVLACDGPVLIAWEHKALPRIPSLLAGPNVGFPREWPSDRFDLVWVLDRDADGTWKFSQRPELLLGGDSPAMLPLD